MKIKEYHEFDPGKEFNKNNKELANLPEKKKKSIDELSDNDDFMLIFAKYLDANELVDAEGKKSTLEMYNMAKEEFVNKFPQEALRYSETTPLVQKNSQTERKGQLEKSIQQTEEDLNAVREKMGVPIPLEKAPSTLTDHEELRRIENNITQIEEKIKEDEAQGEMRESFLEKKHGFNRDTHIDKTNEREQPKKVAEYLADKPEDRDIEIKKEVGERIDKIRQDSPERNIEEEVRQEAIGGVSQESKGVIEKEHNISDDLESEKENLSFAEKIKKVENFKDLDLVLGELGEIKSSHDGEAIFNAQDMRLRINDLRENADHLKEELKDPEFLAYAREYGIDQKIIELLKKEIDLDNTDTKE